MKPPQTGFLEPAGTPAMRRRRGGLGAGGNEGSKRSEVEREEREPTSKRRRQKEPCSRLKCCARPAAQPGGTGGRTGKARSHRTSNAAEKVATNLVSPKSGQGRLQSWHRSRSQAEGEAMGEGAREARRQAPRLWRSAQSSPPAPSMDGGLCASRGPACSDSPIPAIQSSATVYCAEVKSR